MNNQELEEIRCKVALSLTKGVTAALIRSLQREGIDPSELLGGRVGGTLERVGIRGNVLQDADLSAAMVRAEVEVEFMKHHSVEALFIGEEGYPLRLLDLPDAPIVLYKLGSADVNNQKMVSVVGTRRSTARGQSMTAGFIEEWGEMYPGIGIVSGLAYGIDSAAHRAAIEQGLPTIAVLAHGLQMIYPSSNRELARQLLQHGGALLSEYPSGMQPYRGRFLERNRIVAGMSDVTVVMESDIRGGAMSTARCADEYGRTVLAVPGRPGDKESAGCNELIRRHRAEIFYSARQMKDMTGWEETAGGKIDSRSLFPELEGDMRTIYDYLYERGEASHFEEILQGTGLGVSALMSILGEMEMDGVVVRYAGNRFGVV